MGLVSPRYFITIMRWHDVTDVWRASIAQGMFEGFCFGIFFSLLFTAGTGIITGAACRFSFALRHIGGILLGAYLAWFIGGLAGMGLAALSPEFYQRTFIGVPDAIGERLAYAWVGGSIWGAQLGALVSVVLGLVVLRANLRRLQQTVSGQPAERPESDENVREAIATEAHVRRRSGLE